MQKQILSLIAVAIYALISFQACDKEGNETKISMYNGTKSHYAGDNCMTCHKSGGEGEGWFTIAGTVYTDTTGTNILPNATIKLFTGPDGSGEVRTTIEVDALGNFYTTQNIDFSGGLFPSVSTDSGVKYMSTSVTTGACSSCHGTNVTGKLFGE